MRKMTMNKTIIAFTAGVISGGICAWYYTKKKYELIAQEEIDSVKEVFAKRESEWKDNAAKTSDDDCVSNENISVDEYASKIQERGYMRYSDISKEEVKVTDEEYVNDKPYVISPEDFGEYEDYETISLTYYKDKILTDELNEIVEDIEETVGEESLNHFGEYEDDSVFVRNDSKRCDYEILLVDQFYSDVYNN
jgi:hypothetical protein